MKEPDGATPLDPDEKAGLRFPHIDTRGELDQMEHVNIQQGLSWIGRKHITCDNLLTDHFTRELHKQLFSNVWTWAGQYRQTEKNIGITPFQISVQLRNLLDDTKYWIRENTYPAKELALRFHHKLVQIHPFPNGNGRHSRIMTDALLKKCLIEETINWGGRELNNSGNIRTKYIHALRLADRGDYSALLKLYG